MPNSAKKPKPLNLTNKRKRKEKKRGICKIEKMEKK